MDLDGVGMIIIALLALLGKAFLYIKEILIHLIKFITIFINGFL